MTGHDVQVGYQGGQHDEKTGEEESEVRDARISFHSLSGVLILHGVRDDEPVENQTHDGSGPVLLGSGRRRVLYQRSNRFAVGQPQYLLVFSQLSWESYYEFEEKRNLMRERCGLPLPHPGLSAIWLPHVEKKGPIVSFENVGHGKFGWIRGAVDCETGTLKRSRSSNLKT
ncbi:MAG: hypothetical protein Q9196_007191 [Gyalolechia fulgens]